jgi:hypothetical protein
MARNRAYQGLAPWSSGQRASVAAFFAGSSKLSLAFRGHATDQLARATSNRVRGQPSRVGGTHERVSNNAALAAVAHPALDPVGRADAQGRSCPAVRRFWRL